jgi:hypothetical protein
MENLYSQSEGYRLVNLKSLSSTLSEAHICDEGKNTLRQSLSQSGAVICFYGIIYTVIEIVFSFILGFFSFKGFVCVELFCILFISCKHHFTRMFGVYAITVI